MRRILLVGYEDQDNLGIRYLSSRLLAAGHHTRIVAFSTDPDPLLTIIRAERPDVVGFSLIFQYMVPQFAAVIGALRAAGVTAHLTIGGHYASFEPQELLRHIPQLDSVVRFEGEDALAEIVDGLDDGSWREVAGIAWCDDGGGTHLTAPRTRATAIDDLPEPDRRDVDYRGRLLATASVLASRGCPWKCSFCSIITFYEGNGTKGRRRRDPIAVVDELERLARERGAQVILFQDDDFLAGGPAARRWAHTIAAELIRRGLHRQLRFKISCRSDEVSVETLAPLVEAGLCHVYLGVESGDADDLLALNKLLAAEAHVVAGKVLRELDLTFDFGYMLLEPWSTTASVRRSAAFLRSFTADGWTAAGFCRTLPYVGTPVEARLRAEGRLIGSTLDADYRFLDPKLDVLWDFCVVAFDGRNTGRDATWNALRGLLFEAHLDLPGHPRDRDLDEAARALTRASNGLLLDVVDRAVDLVDDGAAAVTDPRLIALARFARREDALVKSQLRGLLRAGRPELYDALFR